MKRFLLLTAGTVIGIALGVWYGWSVSPVTYTGISPDQLRVEYQTDSADQDLGQAAVRLSRLGQADLAGLVRQVAEAYAAAGYPEQDCQRLNRLALDLERYSILPTAKP
jgi:hypothetical protein